MVEPTRGTRMLPEDALRFDWVCARHCPSLEQFPPFADLLFYVFAPGAVGGSGRISDAVSPLFREALFTEALAPCPLYAPPISL
jgi:hypothetical protein